MASNPKLTFEISATDKSAATLAKIKAAVAALGGSVTKTAQGEAKLGKSGGIDRLGRGFKSLGGTAGRAAKAVADVAPALAAITGAASLAGIAALTYKWAHFGQELGFASTRIGITAEKLQGLESAAQIAGASSGSLTTGIRTLKDTITDTIGGRNAEALVYFRTLGIQFQKADGSARGVADVLPEVMDALVKIKDPTLRARAGVALLGGAYEDLAPFIARGSVGLAEYNELARKHGLMNEAGVRSATELARAEAELGLSVRGMGFAIAEGVAPPLKDLLGWMTNLLDLNRKTVSERVGSWAGQFATWIKSIDWDAVAKTIERIAQGISDMIRALANWTPPLWLKKFLGIDDSAGVAATPGAPGKLARPGTSAFTEMTGLAQSAPGPGRGPNGMRSEAALIGAGRTDSGGRIINLGISQWWNDLTKPRGIRNNNPLNLSYVPGQGADHSDGRFGAYGTMEEGIAASHRQLMRYQDEGNDTLIKIIRKWAPPSENDTAGYIHAVSESTGYDPDQKLNMRDPVVAARVMRAMAEREVGRRNAPDANTFAAGIGLNSGGNALAMNAPPIAGLGAGSAAPGGPRGSVDVLVKLQGAPAGSTATVSSSGDVKPRALIERPQFAGAS